MKVWQDPVAEGIAAEIHRGMPVDRSRLVPVLVATALITSAVFAALVLLANPSPISWLLAAILLLAALVASRMAILASPAGTVALPRPEPLVGSRSANWLYACLKRGLDVAFALGLGLTVVPLLPLIALAIRLDSPGPIFYSQQRVGLGNRVFRIYKFRTMRRDAERNGAVWAQVGDPRVTRVGRFLRLSRIDELPQLWNVLRGEMTLVGPRPERPEFTTLLEAEIPGYAGRHAVKPGITGWAQVCYRYTSSINDTRSKLEYDLYYVRNASLLLDLKILVRTIFVVLQLRGC